MSFWDEERVKFYIETWGPPNAPKKWQDHDRMEIPVTLLKGETVLDVGCGLGHLYYALKGKVTEYLGIDSSPHMLEKAREYFPEADFRHGDIHDLSPFPQADTVYSVSLLIHLPSIEEPIQQLWDKTLKRCVILIPMGLRKKIEEPEPGLLYHQVSSWNLKKILKSLEGIERIKKMHWVKRHYFVVLDRQN